MRSTPKHNQHVASRPMRRVASTFFALLLATITLLTPTGCAIFNRDNTPVFNSFEKKLVPENELAVVATFPLTLPLGIISLFIDQFIVRPFQIADDSLDDMQNIFWDDLKWDEEYVAETAFLPWRILFTGLLFPFDFIGRVFFDIPQYDDIPAMPDPKTPEELKKEEIARLEMQVKMEEDQQKRLLDQIQHSEDLLKDSKERLIELQSEIDALQSP